MFNDCDPDRQAVDCSALCILHDLPTAYVIKILFFTRTPPYGIFSVTIVLWRRKKDYMNCCLLYCVHSYEHFFQINYLVKFI